jgi:hypothetical protein
VTIRGEVVDRASLLVVKYFTLRDETSEIKVVTDKSLPCLGEKIRVIIRDNNHGRENL